MKLKIGDKIYFENRYYISGWEKVLKITETMAKTKNYKLSIEANDKTGYIHIKGKDVWNLEKAFLENDDLKLRWDNQKLKNWFSENKDKFSIDQIRKIKSIIDN